LPILIFMHSAFADSTLVRPPQAKGMLEISHTFQTLPETLNSITDITTLSISNQNVFTYPTIPTDWKCTEAYTRNYRVDAPSKPYICYRVRLNGKGESGNAWSDQWGKYEVTGSTVLPQTSYILTDGTNCFNTVGGGRNVNINDINQIVRGAGASGAYRQSDGSPGHPGIANSCSCEIAYAYTQRIFDEKWTPTTIPTPTPIAVDKPYKIICHKWIQS